MGAALPVLGDARRNMLPRFISIRIHLPFASAPKKNIGIRVSAGTRGQGNRVQ